MPNPATPQSWNRFSYTFNNPINYTDPSGHDPWWCTGDNCVADYYLIADKRDLTTWLVAAAVDIAESREMRTIWTLNTSFQGRVYTWPKFISLVGDGAKYDVKDNILEKVGRRTKIGDNWYEYSTSGNILYGFYGKAAGFTEYELRRGAGLAQKWDHDRDPDENEMGPCEKPYYCDTEDDYAAVGFGMHLYENYYEKTGKLTRDDLMDAFDTYKSSNKMALRDKPAGFQPLYRLYRVDQFYNME